MQELHVIALSEDGRYVVLGTSPDGGPGGFQVALDARLAAAVRGDLPRPGLPVRAPLTPRDIQSRLRAGESAEQIASSAGVPITKIDRFSGPVLSEMARVLEAARATVLARTRLGSSVLPLGEAVDRALEQTPGVRLDSVAWSTFRSTDGRWTVQVAYVAADRSASASWVYDPMTRRVTPSDPASAALAQVEAPPRPAAPALPPPPVSAAPMPPAAAPAPPAPHLPPAPAPVAKREGRPARPAARGRAAVPGWADVLLSTSRTADEPDER